MSNYWHYRCLDCNVSHGHFNRGADRLVEIWRDLGPALATLERAGGVEQMIIEYGSELEPQFFRSHEGHRVIVESEYGYALDDCGDRFKCDACDTAHTCHRKKGHDGEHSVDRDYDPQSTDKEGQK